jgi:hypothetical protein
VAAKGTADKALEGLGARLVIAGVLDELRADPESFARLVVAVAQVRKADAAEVAKLLSATGQPVGSAGRTRAAS